MQEIIHNWEALLWSLGVIVFAVIVGLILHTILFQSVRQVAKRTATILDASIYRHCRGPLRVIMPLFAVRLAVPIIPYPFPPGFTQHLGIFISVFLIVAFAWLLVKIINVLEDVILARFKIDVSDNLEARKVVTQMDIIKKIVTFIIIIVTLAVVLMNFENFRQIGTGLLASAGIAGLVIGLAAQRTLSNILAGFQIAITQPIRIDDVVIVENEWGRIEEITLTYVVVAIWDKRRLILPISYFIERPFQNWTRVSADILGTVMLYVDYTIPIEEIRKELRNIVKNSQYWDGQVCGLQTTDARENTVEIRALMSASNSGDAWDLRCEVREKLIEFVQKNYPSSLPKIRAEVQQPFSVNIPEKESKT